MSGDRIHEKKAKWGTPDAAIFLLLLVFFSTSENNGE
jgi:hypothetical protein